MSTKHNCGLDFEPNHAFVCLFFACLSRFYFVSLFVNGRAKGTQVGCTEKTGCESFIETDCEVNFVEGTGVEWMAWIVVNWLEEPSVERVNECVVVRRPRNGNCLSGCSGGRRLDLQKSNGMWHWRWSWFRIWLEKQIRHGQPNKW